MTGETVVLACFTLPFPRQGLTRIVQYSDADFKALAGPELLQGKGATATRTARLVGCPSAALLITKRNHPAHRVPKHICPEAYLAWELQASVSGGPVKGKPVKQAMLIIH